MSINVFKLLPRREWEEAQQTGVFKGSAIDRQDKFMHFSTLEQLAGTARLYFKGQKDILLLTVPAKSLGKQLRWEAPSMGDRGGKFPHLHATLPISKVTDVFECTLMPDDHIRMPDYALDAADMESPPSFLSSGCPTPPSVEEEEGNGGGRNMDDDDDDDEREAMEVFEDPPLVPMPGPPPVVALSGQRGGEGAAPMVRQVSVVDTIIVSFALLSSYAYLVLELSWGGMPRGLALVASAQSFWFVLGFLKLVKCPLGMLAQINALVAVLSVFFVPFFFSASLILFGLGTMLIKAPPMIRLGIDLGLTFVQKHKNL